MMVSKSSLSFCLGGSLRLIKNSEIHLLSLPLSGLPTPHLDTLLPPSGAEPLSPPAGQILALPPLGHLACPEHLSGLGRVPSLLGDAVMLQRLLAVCFLH